MSAFVPNNFAVFDDLYFVNSTCKELKIAQITNESKFILSIVFLYVNLYANDCKQ